MYLFYAQGEGVWRGMPVPATITEQTKILRSTNKAHGKLTDVNLVYTNSVNIDSINKDDISKLLCLSVLFVAEIEFNKRALISILLEIEIQIKTILLLKFWVANWHLFRTSYSCYFGECYMYNVEYNYYEQLNNALQRALNYLLIYL